MVVRKVVLLLLLSTFMLTGVLPNQPVRHAHAAASDYYIGVSDQASQKVLVLDPAVSDWNSDSAIKWSWSPSASNGFGDLTGAWGLPTEVRLRKGIAWGGQWMLMTDSRGLAAIVPYPAGDSKKWALNVGGNPHAIELLPNGNVAIAASTGGWVRVYTSSQGPASSTYAQYNQPGAHAALWDPDNEILWTAGSSGVAGLKIGGTADQPTLTEYRRLDVKSLNAHDVQPVYGDNNRLWVASGGKLYQYVKSTNTLDLTYPEASQTSRVGIKAVGNQLSGQVIETVADIAKNPVGTCTLNSWCTDTVDFFFPNMTRKRTGAAFYKARILNPEYQFTDTEAPYWPEGAGVQADSITDSSMNLAWLPAADNVGVQEYHIVRDGEVIGTVDGAQERPSFAVSNLIGNTSYRFEIEAADKAGNTSRSSPVDIRTGKDLIAPGKPTNVKVSETVKNRLIITFQPPGDRDYAGIQAVVQRNGHQDDKEVVAYQAEVSGTASITTDALKLGKYEIILTAWDTSGNASDPVKLEYVLNEAGGAMN
ncbi:DUF6528 family protein [Paenibacillus sp. HJGM_3]|uniref:DUF6528 family protein n=1 Tax=Paenibacillus sp. HJGM_3 TaxID=3379816 RepID=UPI00385EB6EE